MNPLRQMTEQERRVFNVALWSATTVGLLSYAMGSPLMLRSICAALVWLGLVTWLLGFGWLHGNDER